MATQKLPTEYALLRSTVRILAGRAGQPATSVGTGFFYKVIHPSAGVGKILIVTNKHVVRGADEIHFVLSSAPSVSNLNEHQQPIGRQDQQVTWPLAGNLYLHPDTDTDLCAIDVTIPTGHAIQTGRQLRTMFLDSTWLPNADDKAGLRDIEQVLVIGYPQGIWDHHNNMPIARTGTTATHPLAMYQGKRNFLVDVATFQGSSGSPVFSFESPMFRNPDGSFSPGTKVQFIGIVWGVVERTTEGELKVVEVPSAAKVIPTMNTSLNLGLVLHGEAVRDLDNLIFPGMHAGPMP